MHDAAERVFPGSQSKGFFGENSQDVSVSDGKEARKDFVLSKQLLRSGTSIGANISESKFAQSTPDYISKLSIAQKEANETAYWIENLYKGQYISEKEYESIQHDNEEIIKLLVSSIKTCKKRAGLL